MSFDPYGQPIIKQRSPAPIVLLVLLLLASGAANYWLWTERQRATSEAKAAVSKLAEEEASFSEMKQKVGMLQSENADLAEAKKQLTKDVEAKSGELARLKDDIAGVENGKPADDKADGDKDDKKADAATKDDKKSDKRADKKAADAKADAKAKKKASSSARKKDGARTDKADKPSGEL
jgi:chromosome segregation ATPase